MPLLDYQSPIPAESIAYMSPRPTTNSDVFRIDFCTGRFSSGETFSSWDEAREVKTFRIDKDAYFASQVEGRTCQTCQTMQATTDVCASHHLMRHHGICGETLPLLLNEDRLFLVSLPKLGSLATKRCLSRVTWPLRRPLRHCLDWSVICDPIRTFLRGHELVYKAASTQQPAPSSQEYICRTKPPNFDRCTTSPPPNIPTLDHLYPP
jgi:hypothetical protein